MAVSYQEVGGGQHIGTMTCDQECGRTFRDGQVDEHAHTFRARAAEAGWRSERPNAYRQVDICPECPEYGS